MWIDLLETVASQKGIEEGTDAWNELKEGLMSLGLDSTKVKVKAATKPAKQPWLKEASKELREFRRTATPEMRKVLASHITQEIFMRSESEMYKQITDFWYDMELRYRDEMDVEGLRKLLVYAQRPWETRKSAQVSVPVEEEVVDDFFVQPAL